MQPGGESAEQVAVNVEVIEVLAEIRDVKQYNQTVSDSLRISPTMHSDLKLRCCRPSFLWCWWQLQSLVIAVVAFLSVVLVSSAGIVVIVLVFLSVIRTHVI